MEGSRNCPLAVRPLRAIDRTPGGIAGDPELVEGFQATSLVVAQVGLTFSRREQAPLPHSLCVYPRDPALLQASRRRVFRHFV